MNELPAGKPNKETNEQIEFRTTYSGKYRVLAAFIICISVLIAAFAASSIWQTTESGKAFFEKIGNFFSKNDENNEPPSVLDTTPSQDNSTQLPSTGDPDIPNDAVKIVSMDLSCLKQGDLYYLNETAYQPNLQALLNRDINIKEKDTSAEAPLVLIVHTHTIESYYDGNSDYIDGDLSDTIYSADNRKNMIAVGKVLSEVLNENGVPTLHCSVVHTGDDMSLQGSYERTAQSIQSYLKVYPSIRLVIDLHRDSVLTEDGEYIKTEVPNGNSELAQVMAVVGTDSNGTPCNWEDNLALALQLRKKMNNEDQGISRPIYLRNSSYNQELANYSLLLEIGTGANTLEQAKRTAEKIGDALASIILSD